MKRIIALTTAALLGASMFAASALAQVSIDAGGSGGIGVEAGGGSAGGVDVDAGASGSTTLPSVDDGTTAAIGAEATIDSALSAIEGSTASAAAVEAMAEVNDINVVKLSELENSGSADVEGTISANQSGVDELRSSIEANAALNQELQTQGVEVASVVGAQVEADGALTVFVDDQQAQ